jgi:hypothetical protein
MNKTLIICTVLVVSLKTTMEMSEYYVRHVSDGRDHVVLVWKMILFVNLVRDKQCFVLSLYPLYLIFLHSLNIIFFLCKFFTSQN